MTTRIKMKPDDSPSTQELHLPTIENVRRAIQAGEDAIASRVKELDQKIPSWDPELDNLRLILRGTSNSH